MVPLGLFSIVWAFYGFSLESFNAGLAALFVVTVFFSSYLRIQLPRTKIHLTVSDGLIILALLIYGGEVAVIIATFESLVTTLNFRRQGINIKNRTIILNVAVAAFSAFVTTVAVNLFFVSPVAIVQQGDKTEFIGLLTVMALSQFIVNSICAAIYIALKSEKSIWQVRCLTLQ